MKLILLKIKKANINENKKLADKRILDMKPFFESIITVYMLIIKYKISNDTNPLIKFSTCNI